MKNKTKRAIIAEAQRVLLEEHVRRGGDKRADVTIYTWYHDNPQKDVPRQVGLRVAEVSFFVSDGNGGGAGSAYMQSDVPHGLAACAAVERFCLGLVTGLDKDEPDEFENDKWAMFECVFGPENRNAEEGQE